MSSITYIPYNSETKIRRCRSIVHGMKVFSKSWKKNMLLAHKTEKDNKTVHDLHIINEYNSFHIIFSNDNI